MPFTTSPPHQRSGHPISARSLNASAQLLERLGGMRGGQGTVWTPAGPQLRREGELFRLGTTPSGGIAGRDTGGVYAAEATDLSLALSPTDPLLATLQSWTTTFPAFNLSASAVAGNATIICQWMWGLWIVMWEECST